MQTLPCDLDNVNCLDSIKKILASSFLCWHQNSWMLKCINKTLKLCTKNI